MSGENAVYRKETCSFGRQSVELLKEKGIEFEDHIFSSQDEEAAFKREHDVDATPQIFLEGQRIGGYSDLADRYGVSVDAEDDKSYVPVIAVFATTALLAWATSTGIMGFMGYSLSVLALLKLMDISSFVEGFEKYDLLTAKYPAYARLYPFLELGAGLGFLSGAVPLLTGLVAAFVGIAGGYSVYRAVYVDDKDLDCACVGGNQNVPLGAISFTENAMMAVMGLYLLLF